jgi:hypothetical protein
MPASIREFKVGTKYDNHFNLQMDINVLLGHEKMLSAKRVRSNE